MLVFPFTLHNNEYSQLMAKLAVSKSGADIMENRFNYSTFVIKGISGPGANIVKQHLLSLGGEAAVPHHALNEPEKKCDLVFTLRNDKFPYLLERFRQQCWGLKGAADSIESFLKSDAPWFSFRHTGIPSDRPAVMGILNVTPDSFSDGGKYIDADRAVAHAIEMLEAGADIIDIGGESSRPGAMPVDAEEEIRRTVPVIKEIKRLNKNAVISIDTTKLAVARKAVDAGADIINDISGLSMEPELAGLAAERNIPIILMHMQGTPRTMQADPQYSDIIAEIIGFLQSAIEKAEKAGVKKEKIIIDPGIGFGKTVTQNLFILKHLESFQALGMPVLAGLSRKSFIGKITCREIATERFAGTVAANTIALEKGAAIIRAHDIAGAKDAVAMSMAVGEAVCF